MRSVRRRVFLCEWAVCAACAAGVSSAVALAPRDARAEGDDHAATQALVVQIAGDTAHSSITSELLDRARRQIERAIGLRVTYDEKRARAADGAAREWAETARDVLRAVDGETKAADVRRKALDAQAQVDRTRALVDEDTARIGRLKAELANAEKEAKAGTDPDRRAVEVHEGDAPPPKKGAKKAGAHAAGKDTTDPTGGKP
jgi:hypothetical protein